MATADGPTRLGGMVETAGPNAYDRLGRLRRLTTPLEVAQIERFGTSALAALFRTQVLVLHATGRRTGLPRRTPLACTPDPQTPGPDGPHPATPGAQELGIGRLATGRCPLLVVGGAGGQVRTPDWVANLRAEPRAAITHRRRRLPVVAHELVGDERDALWPHLIEVWPRITTYEHRAGHPIPVFRLRPIDDTS
jgi:deazaflavin-dependent oxidoreductase (nitroreductase family)